ncbi:LysR family transcriptional regulator [Streptomyces fodineus]|uniref:LysR family transcriptional regulator n=1 Tax=Streptomyces fodineus TaxID=1904616 RepID=A0A1D7Y4G0_9ACTN|nr:LysR family transcriptional regulator [Streptomyces fodineus]AOR30475.1 LysR family transcriptional regulator [Streptomyces fodineus]
MDLKAVRTFVAVVDTGQFQEASAVLGITQQAVSKRIAALEKDLAVRLFTRTARGAQPTIDGQAFLPHARELLLAEERALASVRPGGRALRVDVIGARLAPAALLREFHEAQPGTALDAVTLFDASTAVAAVRAGTIDATIRAVTTRLPQGLRSVRVLDEPVQLLTGARHPLAGARSVTPAQLAGHRIWMPGLVDGTEWAAYYTTLAAEFGLTIDSVVPDFGGEPLLDAVAGSDSLATFVCEQIQLSRPAGRDLRRIPLTDPTPVYPHSLVWAAANTHPGLAALRAHLTARLPARPASRTWTPAWAVRGVFPARRP